MEVAFFKPATGLSFLTRLLKDYNLIPEKDESICSKIFKGTAVFIISSIALPIICTYAITHYNAPGFITKTIGAASSYLCNRTIFNYTYKDFWPDIKKHVLFSVTDFFVIVGSPIFTLFLLIKPDCISSLNHHIATLC